ncbi:MAG: hypothetical protein RI973_1317 [Bacteroidota bacterium]|jgi:hypothetical protein
MHTNFEIYQWLVPVISILYLSRTVLQMMKNKRSVSSGLIWIIFWLTITVLAVIPNPVSFKIATLMGFKSNINAIIFVALGWLFLLVFYLSSSIDRVERQITILVRKIAISESEKPDSLNYTAGFDSSPATVEAVSTKPKPERRKSRYLKAGRKNLALRSSASLRRKT